MGFKAQLQALGKNTIALNIATKHSQDSLGATHFGGQPDVPENFIWPYFQDKPLAFLAQFNCADLTPYDSEHLLPTSGLLLFFYELETQSWGYDPQDKGCARVFYFEDIASLHQETFPHDLDEEFCLPCLKIALSQRISYPSWQDCPLSDTEDHYEQAFTELDQNPNNLYSQLLGWPDTIQNDMFAECELVAQGYYLGSAWSHIPKETIKQAQQHGPERWQLLFQLDTVEDEQEDFYLMFGDAGHIYFFIPKEDLAQRNFDNIHLILQCY